MQAEQLAIVRKAVPRIPRVTVDPRRRPFWSVMIPTCRRGHVLAETLRSVLAQAPGPDRMQIMVLDDGPGDDGTEALVRELGRGRIGYLRHQRSLGTFGNSNACIRRATGHWVHILHDDDWVTPGFYATLEPVLADPPTPALGAALTAITVCDPARGLETPLPAERDAPGLLDDWLFRTATRAPVQPPAVVVRRDVYETLGGYNLNLPVVADWEMWQRIAAHYAWWYEPGARACYREHGPSVTGTSKHTGANIRDAREAIRFACAYWPADRHADLHRGAIRFWASMAYVSAHRLIATGDYQGGAAQLIECLRTDQDPALIQAVITMGNRLKQG